MNPSSSTPEDHISRLEEQISLLCLALGIENDDPRQVVPEQVVELVRQDHPVQAMHKMRQLTGAGLVASRQLVEATATTLGAPVSTA